MSTNNLEEKNLQPLASETPRPVEAPEMTQPTVETRPAPESSKPAGRPSPVESDNPRFKLPTFRKSPTVIPNVRDEVSMRIEKIMSEDLLDAYQKLSPIAQQEFKIKGEETATKIRVLLQGTRIKVKKIFHLIYEWLKMLPGINKFFLEQEAKIKTDKIIMLNKRDHE